MADYIYMMESRLTPDQQRAVALVQEVARTHELLVTVEEHQAAAGAGSAVCEALAKAKGKVLLLGLPDRFVDHGDPGRLLASVGLDAEGIRKSITAVMSE